MALIMFMGIDTKPTMESYWSDGMLGTPLLKKITSFNRFFLLDLCLHFVDTSTPLPDTAPHLDHVLWRIKPFFDAIISNFKDVYIPGESSRQKSDDTGRLQIKFSHTLNSINQLF